MGNAIMLYFVNIETFDGPRKMFLVSAVGPFEAIDYASTISDIAYWKNVSTDGPHTVHEYKGKLEK